MCALCLWTSGSYWFERGLRLFLIFCMCSRFCMCMCVAVLSVRSCLHSLLLDFGLSTCCFACSVFDSHHHSLAPYFKCYGSDFADLVLRIKPVGVVLLSIIRFLETARSIYLLLGFLSDCRWSWRVCALFICRSRSCSLVLDIRGPPCLVDKCPSHSHITQSVGISRCVAFYCSWTAPAVIPCSGFWVLVGGASSWLLLLDLEPKDALSDLTCAV